VTPAKRGKSGADTNGSPPKPPLLRRARRWMERDIWQRELSGLPTFRRIGIHAMRVTFLLWRGLREHESFFRAQALTYVTVLSLVPLLAFGFSVAKGFGAYDYLIERAVTPFLDNTFGPLHAESLPPEERPVPEIVRASEERALEELTERDRDDGSRSVAGPPGPGGATPRAQPATQDRADTPFFIPRAEDARSRADGDAPTILIDEEKATSLRQLFEMLLQFVARTNVANIGILGLIFLVIASLKLMAHIEAAYNTIWSVARPRTLVRKFADYMAIIAVTPLLALLGAGLATLFGSGAATKYLREELHLGPFVELALRLVPFVALWLAFSVLCLVMPNTRVRLRSAAIGGFFSALVWTLIQVGYVRLQLGMAQYNALYSGLAAVPLFLVWVWLSWVAVLLGAEIAYADQHSEVYLRKMRGRPLDASRRRTLGLALAVQATENFLEGRQPVDVESLLVRFMLPESELDDVVCRLEKAGVIARIETDGEMPCVTLARDPGRVRVSDVLSAVDGGEVRTEGDAVFDPRAERALYELAFELESSQRNQTLRDLAGRSV
jgi:membrane protein